MSAYQKCTRPAWFGTGNDSKQTGLVLSLVWGRQRSNCVFIKLFHLYSDNHHVRRELCEKSFHDNSHDSLLSSAIGMM